MKRFDFPLDKYQVSRLSSSFRSKKDVIIFWMNSIKIIATYSRPADDAVVGRLVLHVDKMSRIFMEIGAKTFSISFPFSIHETDEGLEFGSPVCPLVDSKITSDILLLINGSGILSSRNILDFADPIMDLAGEQEITWELLRDLMTCDDGYLRIDHDPENENGNIHPLNHVDIFYSQSATFKVGLRDRSNLDDFHDILNLRTNCRFLGLA